MTQDFVDTSDERKEYQDRRKTEFMKMTDGNSYTLRILQVPAKKIYTHFLNRKYAVECLGNECPICARNSEIYNKDNKNYSKDPDYVARQKRYYVNVLDKTLVKKCPECGTEYNNLNAGLCNKCSKTLNDPEPSNTVKVLSKGPAVFSQFNDIHNAVLDDAGEKLGINNFDLVLVVNGRGKDTKITVIPEAHKNKPVEGTYELFDLSNSTIELEPDEMLDVQRGVSLKDIFAARRAEKEAEFPPKEVVSEETLADVTDAVNKLFSQ